MSRTSTQTTRNEIDERKQSKFSTYLELFIVCSLSISIAVIFFNTPRWTRAFGEAGFGALLLWAIYQKRKPVFPIPGYLIVLSLLYILSYVINVFMSPDPTWEHVNIRKYIYIIIGGLLVAFPVKDIYRRFMIIVFFSSAAIAGAAGIYQYFKGGAEIRAEGFSGNPLHYAGLLGIVCCISSVMLCFDKRRFFETTRGVFFLLFVALLTFSGILFSQARGVWIAVVAASTVTLFLHNRQKAIIFLLCIMTALTVIISSSHVIRTRATSIVTSIYTEDETGDAGARIELWKGAILIFKESPLLGIGTGNFELSIKKLIQSKKLKEPPTTVHAHNIFLQALATRGVIGFIITVGLFIAQIKWGMEEIRNYGNIGGYMIVLCTAFTMISGLTENNIEFTKFLAAYCFTVGLFGPLGAIDNSKKVIVQDE